MFSRSPLRRRLSSSAPTEVKVEERFSSRQNSYIAPSHDTEIDASDVIFFVAGINGQSGKLEATPKAAKIGIGNLIHANFFVPNGTLWLRQNTEATGAFLAKDVIVGKAVHLTLDSFFAPQSGMP